jgi:hypothetical protein
MTKTQKRIAPVERPEPLVNREQITDAVCAVMHQRYRDASIDQLLCQPIQAALMAIEVARRTEAITKKDAERLWDGLLGVIENGPKGIERTLNNICRTALASRKRGDLRKDRY